MGFGILVTGYMFLLSIPISSMGIPAELIGYIMLSVALWRLKQYEKWFSYALYVDIALIPCGVFSILKSSLLWFGRNDLYEKIHTTAALPYSIVLAVLLLLFHLCLMEGVRRMAKEVDLPNIVEQAVRSVVLTWFYFALSVSVVFLNIPKVTEVIPYTHLIGIVMAFSVVWLLLNLKVLYCCYALICMPGEEELPEVEQKLPAFLQKKKKTEPEEPSEERYARRKAEYNEAMRQRQLERTKKNKRRKRH
ncbi:MAG: hypothetical protein IJC98_06090 [Clostridia bacterium]|nr:hypothetical protein [Clostridia bacterium]